MFKKSSEEKKLLKSKLPLGTHYSFRIPWEARQVYFTHARKSRIWDVDGNEHLDLFGKFGANILGHNLPQYNEALIDALGQVSAANLGVIDRTAVELICDCVPCAEMVRFSLSGTEAVLNALRLARAYTGRNKFVRFEGHYHGNADNLMGGRAGPKANPAPEEFEGDFYGTGGKATDIAQHQSFLIPWNDIERLQHLVETKGHEIAAILMEPININGGGRHPAPGYLKAVRALCDRHGIVLIFDEVITGFRLGLGGAQDMLGVTPDLTTLGKAMSGGAVPVSAVAGRRKIMSLIESRKVSHGGTFNGYQLGLAAVIATLSYLRSNPQSLYGNMIDHMRLCQDHLRSEGQAYGIPLSITGEPACSVFSYAPTQADEAPDPKAQFFRANAVKLIGEAMAEKGVLLSNLNRLYGNVSLESEDVDLFRERTTQAFEKVAAFAARFKA
ncbi:aminotransferase class III-fold pyridoxal phosphate-dependent enzyme [Phaeobacter sp. B1627]|nr:aminotransferase class III-fold pyridoxal phosphate-dependent enzyme [Phaeobacter sp. B1627]